MWDRDRDDRAWQDAVIKAAIEKEKIERQFVEPRNRGAGAGSREKEWPILPTVPEPIKTSPQYHFEDAARATARPEPEPPLPENLRGTAAHIWTAWHQSDTAKAFAAAINEQGMALAVVTKEEASPQPHGCGIRKSSRQLMQRATAKGRSSLSAPAVMFTG